MNLFLKSALTLFILVYINKVIFSQGDGNKNSSLKKGISKKNIEGESVINTLLEIIEKAKLKYDKKKILKPNNCTKKIVSTTQLTYNLNSKKFEFKDCFDTTYVVFPNGVEKLHLITRVDENKKALKLEEWLYNTKADTVDHFIYKKGSTYLEESYAYNEFKLLDTKKVMLEGVLDREYVFLYDEKHLKASEEIKDAYGKTLTYITFLYDDKNNVIEKTVFFDAGLQRMKGKEQYEYYEKNLTRILILDAKNNPVKEIRKSIDGYDLSVTTFGFNQKEIDKTAIAYSDKSKNVPIEKVVYLNGKIRERTDYRKDLTKNMISDYSIYDGANKLKNQVVLFYNKENHLVKEDWFGMKEKLEKEIIYIRNHEGVLYEKIELGNDEQIQNKTIYVYSYY